MANNLTIKDYQVDLSESSDAKLISIKEVNCIVKLIKALIFMLK